MLIMLLEFHIISIFFFILFYIFHVSAENRIKKWLYAQKKSYFKMRILQVFLSAFMSLTLVTSLVRVTVLKQSKFLGDICVRTLFSVTLVRTGHCLWFPF